MTTTLKMFQNFNMWRNSSIAAFCFLALLTSCSNISTPLSNAQIIEEEKKYFGQVNNKIYSQWKLPGPEGVESWDENLTAIVVIVVKKNGIVNSMFFEKRSGNESFDKYIVKTIRKSVPLPPFPPELEKETLEIGLRFRPQSSNKK